MNNGYDMEGQPHVRAPGKALEGGRCYCAAWHKSRKRRVRRAATSSVQTPDRRSVARRGIMGPTEDRPLPGARPWPLVPIAILLAGAILSGGAPAAPPATSSLSERATVELVLIEVYVADGRGRPIRDLTADDFALMVDG